MEPNYVAKKSAWEVINFWWIISCILILPILIIALRVITVKKYTLSFYDDKIIVESGWLNKNKRQVVFMGITGISVSQGLWGQICNYGDVQIDAVGKWDVDTTNIIDPKGLEAYLQTKTAKMNQVNQFVQM